MSKEQGEPKGNRSELHSFIVLAIIVIAIFSVVLVFHESGPMSPLPPGKYRDYSVNKDYLQNAVIGYATDHNGSLPTLNGIYTNANCSNCNVINISALVVANGGMLREAPDGLNLSASGNDNCGGNAALGCSNGSSYIWIVNTDGTAFTYCAGAGCTTNNSGYQDVWP